MDKKYNHQVVEKNRYQKWLELQLFKVDPTSKKPKFCVILPPPNITGQLHLGHAWDGALQDLLVRYKRLQGFEALFLPGMDHAGIATQVKVLERLKCEHKLDIKKMVREKFLDYAWKWKAEYAAIIREQWAKLGLSLDYNREKFTLDQDVYHAVAKVFVELYHKKMIYQGVKIVNWDPFLQTAISNIEVSHKLVKGKLYYLKYYLENSNEYLQVATTRPETMFADQAVIVNSNDKRYERFINKNVINPVNKQILKVIGDDYVDMEFASGVMKCTPGHDFNDYELAVKHQLKMPLCFDQAGKMNSLAGKYQGLDRFVCRKNLIAALTKQDLLIKVIDYEHQVGFSERTNVVVEPYLSKQWFVKMAPTAKMLLKMQENKPEMVNFFPKLFEKQLLRWVINGQDWCISRQLWWGHRIPVWYHKTNKTIYVGINPPTNISEYEQDPDVLDTWFSSALWPLVTLGWPNEQQLEFKNYYPTSVLVTAYDILFFWVVRMLFMGLNFTKQRPFHQVLIHGLIRDEQGRKMSKSLNNGINPIAIIDDYGADALRYFLITNCAPGQDLRFSIPKIKASWNLINKLWNAARYVLIQKAAKIVKPISEIKSFNFIDQWILTELNSLSQHFHKNMEKYEFVVVSHYLEDFIWNRYCSWYIELSKYNLQKLELQENSLATLWYCLTEILKMLHPFMPFVTEAIYELMGYKNSIMNESYKQPVTFTNDWESAWFVKTLIAIIGAIREIRKELRVSFKDKILLHLNTKNSIYQKYHQQLNQYLMQLTNSEISTISDNKLVASNKITKFIDEAIIEITTTSLIDISQEKAKWEGELVKIADEITRSNKILSNENFVKKAAVAKIAAEKAKLQKYQEQYLFLQNKIKNLS